MNLIYVHQVWSGLSILGLGISVLVMTLVLASLKIIITLANKKILAYKVRAVLGYIGGAEFENDLIFFRLALVFEIF